MVNGSRSDLLTQNLSEPSINLISTNPTSGIILRLYFSSSGKSTLNTFAFVERWAYCHNDSLSYPQRPFSHNFSKKLNKPFCPLKPSYIIHLWIIYESYISHQRQHNFGAKNSNSVIVIWWNRNPSRQKKLSNEVWPAKDTGHSWRTRL